MFLERVFAKSKQEPFKFAFKMKKSLTFWISEVFSHTTKTNWFTNS